MNTIAFFVPGEPRPKQSFRYSSKGGGYTEPRIKAWQTTVSCVAKENTNEPLVGDLTVHLSFILGNRRRVDLDNLSKGVLDACNGICWKDDMQITRLAIDKIVSKKEKDVGVLVVIHDN